MADASSTSKIVNLNSTIEIYAGGPGSGCRGENCGRPAGEGTSVVEPTTAPKIEVQFASLLKLAKQLGFPESKVKEGQGTQTFTLNGQQYNYAGAANLQTGDVTFWAQQIPMEQMRGIVAHEVTHQIFGSVLNAYQSEKSSYMREAQSLPDKDPNNPMDRAGYLKPEFAEKYPLVAAFDRTSMGDLLKKGVSTYSQAWVDAWQKGEVHTDQALHEVMAEMSAVKSNTGKLPGTPVQKQWYKNVERFAKEQGWKMHFAGAL